MKIRVRKRPGADRLVISSSPNGKVHSEAIYDSKTAKGIPRIKALLISN